MPRYEHSDGTRFWEIEKAADGKSFTAKWGKIGGAGQAKTKKFKTAFECMSAYDELVAEKLKVGYSIKATKPGGFAFAIKSNPALEAAICEANDDARWSVYADWLQEAGDVRGEIIALGLAGKHDAAKKLVAQNQDVLWGDAAYLLDAPWEKVTWVPAWNDGKPLPVALSFKYRLGKHGFVDSIEMLGLDEEGHVAKAMSVALTSPIGRFTRSVTLSSCLGERFSGPSGQPDFGAVAAAMARAKPAALAKLAIRTGGYQLSWTQTGELAPLLAETPNLEELEIEQGSIALGAGLELPKLRRLAIETGGLGRDNVVAIANAKWPALTELVIYFGRKDYGGDTAPADIKALLASKSFPKLRSLALCNSEIQGDIVREIATSPLLEQLKTLDLSKGTLIDDEAKPIVDNLRAFQNLERLDLSDNYLSPDFEETLNKSFGKIYASGHSRYAEMVSERARYGNEEWAKDATFRYTDIGE